MNFDAKKSSFDFGVNIGGYIEPKKGLTIMTAVVFIAGELAGSGILAFPNAMASTGWYGMAILLSNAVLACYSGVCLARCWLMLEERWPEYRGPQRNPFPSIGLRANGKWASYLCSAVMDITFFGGSVVYLLLCCELVESLTKSFIKHITFCDWIIILAICLIPLTWLGSPADFWPLAVAANVTTLLGLVLLLANIGIDAGNESRPPVQHSAPTFKSFFLGFGVITFGFGGAAAFPTFQNDMKDKTKFPVAVIIAFSVVLLVFYLPVSVAGYVVYGTGVANDILNSASDGALKTATMICFAIHLFLAFLILLNPAAQEVENFFKIPEHFTYKRCITRTAMMVGIAFVALSVPQFGKILSLIGGSTITLMALILPPIFYLSLIRQQDENKDWPKRHVSLPIKIFLVMSVVIGLVAGVASTYFAFYDLVDPDVFKPPCYVNWRSFYAS